MNGKNSEARAGSTIRLSLAPKIKYSIMNEKSPSILRQSQNRFICQNSLPKTIFEEVIVWFEDE